MDLQALPAGRPAGGSGDGHHVWRAAAEAATRRSGDSAGSEAGKLMTSIRTCRDHFDASRILLLVALALLPCLSAVAAASDLITGAVRNRSRNQAAVGDEVILLRLDQGMQEEARTRTDDLGAFTIKVQVPDKLHLVRILHQSVNYDQQASPGDALTIDVFDAAAKVQGITGTIEIIRTGSKGNLLHVSDMIEIKNESQPPLTQAGARTFEVYLPAKARLDSVMAAGSGKLAVLISALPVAGEPGHYTVNFPLRPGSTKFAFNYDVPYDGHAAFRPRLAYPLQQLAVMFPPTMKFSSHSNAFQLLATGDGDYQVQAANQVKAGEGPAFEISGAGAMPPLQARAQPQTKSQAAAAPEPAVTATANPGPQSSPRGNLAGAAATTASPSAVEWWLLAGSAVLVLGACGFLVWRAGRRRAKMEAKSKAAAAKAGARNASATPLLDALKEQLLELETGRLEGSISREEYDAAKRVLEGTVKRALARTVAKS